MPYEVEWKQGAIEDVTALFDYIAENSSLWDAQNVTDRVLAAADKLADFPPYMKWTHAMARTFAGSV
ncbi:type II toxin-antitoxin system RelE/ParE family toxin [Klebsiella pneumoniae]|nr:type II toxin-antitoxin system RelE/ParE family toxin [Klebsiella pneumoniae]